MHKQSTQSTGLEYEQENERSTCGRGARASYLTKFSKISTGGQFWSQTSDACRQAGRKRNARP